MKPKKQKSALQKQSEREAVKAFRHNISVLKKAGIVSKKVDARSLAPSPHYKKLIREYADVITGKVKAVKVPKACPVTGCKTVKKNNKTIALVNVEGMYKPRVTVKKTGISVIDKLFGSTELNVMINRPPRAFLDMSPDELFKLEYIPALDKAGNPILDDSGNPTFIPRVGNTQSFVFTIEDKKHGKSYMSKMSFSSLDRLIDYMALYAVGSRGADFNSAVVSIRIMGDKEISDYQDRQSAETEKNKRARHAEYKRNKRAKNKATKNII